MSQSFGVHAPMNALHDYESNPLRDIEIAVDAAKGFLADQQPKRALVELDAAKKRLARLRGPAATRMEMIILGSSSEAHARLGDDQAALVTIDRAIILAREVGDSSAAATLLERMGHVKGRMGLS